MEIKVWTTANCSQCLATKLMFKKLGISYEELSLEEHPEKLEEFKAQGLMAAPIVETDRKVWSGFRHDKITSLATFLLGERKNELR